MKEMIYTLRTKIQQICIVQKKKTGYTVHRFSKNVRGIANVNDTT